MNDQILEAIKKKAEEKFEVVPHPNLPQIIMDRYEPLRVAYTSGQVDAIEMMFEFIVWAEKSNYWVDEYEEDGVTKRDSIRFSNDSVNPQYYTTEQLLSEYIKTLNNG